ncbi:hypothetical protein OG301_39035 (plasmid) [Streptomyces platensis]|uniref:hypothetical protein n=1 Tax=Streptomyces platensis TaxID=58346 RepID=UPI002ED19699|nr:hypothetical protein OG301_39035 [Streptomyces platensis]
MTIDPAAEVARLEAERALLPKEERQRLEAGDAPLLRIQLLYMLERARKAERAVGLLADSHRRAKQAEAAIDRVRALHQPVQHMGQTWCDGCSVRRSTGPKTCEWVAFIPHPCPTLQAVEETQ